MLFFSVEETFSKLLTRVPWSDTKLYSHWLFFATWQCLISIWKILTLPKAQDLRKYYNLHFVTSSLEKKVKSRSKVKLDRGSTMSDIPIFASFIDEEVSADYEQPKRLAPRTYVHSRAKGLLLLGYSPPSMDEDAEVERQIKMREEYGGECSPRVYKKPEVASNVAASTMTTVVAAEENVKQEAAEELQSLHSSPCEWLICDDPSTFNRCFIIQVFFNFLVLAASWQQTLFEPTKFEVRMLLLSRFIIVDGPIHAEILNHLRTYGDLAKIRLIGHSLGGSLSLLVNLMLLSRGVSRNHQLACSCHRILEELGLDENHVHSVMMHKDIVPRAFSCNYPNHVAQVLKRLNRTFRSHPCLNKNKMLYTPLGQLFILQPNEKLSPSHPLLPPGGALYALDKTQCGSHLGIKSALKAFLNSPHPLETLSDPTTYGSEGTILRDHDSSNYLKAMNGVLRQRMKLVVRNSRKEGLHQLWPLLTTSQSWRDRQHLENRNLVSKEVITGA
ncbi:hypothetical protein MKW92_044586 [Papaver armeniacum]|nr:hypothetical protein MKW92_044586 [Papaver armeniacum]